MQKSVARFKLESHKTLLFSAFLPKFTLLAHPKVKIFVTHDGMGSITDFIKRRKPSLCSPQLFDQHYNCKKVKELGLVEVAVFDFNSVNVTIRIMLANYDYYATNSEISAKRFEKSERIEKYLRKSRF